MSRNAIKMLGISHRINRVIKDKSTFCSKASSGAATIVTRQAVKIKTENAIYNPYSDLQPLLLTPETSQTKRAIDPTIDAHNITRQQEILYLIVECLFFRSVSLHTLRPIPSNPLPILFGEALGSVRRDTIIVSLSLLIEFRITYSCPN